jgi:hypothetical protein
MASGFQVQVPSIGRMMESVRLCRKGCLGLWRGAWPWRQRSNWTKMRDKLLEDLHDMKQFGKNIGKGPRFEDRTTGGSRNPGGEGYTNSYRVYPSRMADESNICLNKTQKWSQRITLT